MYPFPGAVDAPRPEVVVGGLPRQEEVVRKQPPGAPSPKHIEDGVQQLAGLVSSRASAGLGSGDERFEDTPFVVGEVCGVGSTGGHGTAAPSRFGSRILRTLTPSQTPSRRPPRRARLPSSRVGCGGGI